MKAIDQENARKAARRAKLLKRLFIWACIAVPFIALAALLDPQRKERAARDAEAQQELAARQAIVAQVPKTTAKDSDVLNLSFSKLEFEVPTEAARPKDGQPKHEPYAPERIKNYDGRNVRIRGYMLPVRMERGMVRECLLMVGQMTCCYGVTPQFWEFVAVRIENASVPALQDVPLYFEGKLKVGDVYENGYWTQFYTMDCTSVTR